MKTDGPSNSGPTSVSLRGDNGPHQVVLNATLQLNAAAAVDNREEQIIRIRDKDALVEQTSSSSSRSSTLLDNKHQVRGGGVGGDDKGPAKVNLHESDTIVNISSQVGVISGTDRPTGSSSPPPPLVTRTTKAAAATSSSRSSTDRKSVKEGDEQKHHHLSLSHDTDSEDGDEDDEDEEEEEEAIKSKTTTESNDKNTIISADNVTPDKKVITANYNRGGATQSSPRGTLVPSEVDLVVPQQHHGNAALNIERAVGENGEQLIIIAGEDDEDEVVNVHKNHFVDEASLMASQHKSDPADDEPVVMEEPIALPLRPIIRDPFDEMDDEAHQGETTIVYAELRSEVTINCEVDMDIALNTWFHDGQVSGQERRRVCVLFIKGSLSWGLSESKDINLGVLNM